MNLTVGNVACDCLPDVHSGVIIGEKLLLAMEKTIVMLNMLIVLSGGAIVWEEGVAREEES